VVGMDGMEITDSQPVQEMVEPLIPEKLSDLMASNLSRFHTRHRSEIINEWIRRLHTEVSEQYSARPSEELRRTVSEAFESNFQFLVHEDLSYIDYFIKKITAMRLEAGFKLSDVQKAFELYRSIVVPMLAKETTVHEFMEEMEKINQCLAYTIHRFSDFFQGMHERSLTEHNRKLEKVVHARTLEMHESELKYKTLVEEINEGYFVIRNEVIVFANTAFCEMHGYPQGEVLGKKFYYFIDPASRGEILDIYERSLRKESVPQVFEYLRLTKTGHSYPTEITAKRTSYKGQLSNIGICRDITERVKLQKKVREAERMVYIGEITTSLSHEIRNPLSAVKMNLQILKKNPSLCGNDRRRIDISVREVDRLERILKELLDFAKPIRIEQHDLNINHVFSRCIELLEMKSRGKGVTFVRSMDAAVPKVRVDGEKMTQVFINLLLNAIEASPEGGEIIVASRYHPNKGNSAMEITLEDEGHGILEQNVDHIFDPFFTTKSSGSGLGLTIAKRIVEAHDGRLEAEQRYPRGSVFRVWLPARSRPWGKSSS
jgi:PAS domain S-box-containing protein